MISTRVSIVVGLIVIAGAVASLPVLRQHSPMFNFIFSPSDLYLPLAAADVDLSQENRTFTLQFENKYPGLHWVAIQVEKPTTTGEGYSGAFVLNLEISHDKTPLVKETIKGPGNPFWGGPNRSGFALHWYRSPADIPLGEQLTATVTVVQGDAAFQKRYGGGKLVVSKLSDE